MWRFLTAAEGRTLEALCEQIIPADQTPGAAWAGVVNYIERQLMGPFRRQRDVYRRGLAALDQAARQFGGGTFAALEPPRQTALLSSDHLSNPQGEARRFFSMVIAHTMQGYYGDPRHPVRQVRRLPPQRSAAPARRKKNWCSAPARSILGLVHPLIDWQKLD